MLEKQNRWNDNTHYYDMVVDAAPSIARTALDVGTGDGLLATRLAETIPDVTGIDTAPGGALLVIGRARGSTVSDYARDAVGIVRHQFFSRTHGFWQHNAPVQMQFPHPYTEIKRIAATVLPGMKWRRLTLWRYAIT